VLRRVAGAKAGVHSRHTPPRILNPCSAQTRTVTLVRPPDTIVLVKQVSRQLTVQFYAIEPGFPATFLGAEYPLTRTLASIRQSDPATDEYRIKEDIFGGETLCLLHEDTRFPLLGAYYKDTLSMPMTEMKGQVEKLILRDGEGIVDSSFAAFFEDDVVGIVRTSVKAPGHAKIGTWLSINERPPMYLVPLPEVDVLSRLGSATGRIKRFILRIRREDIPKVHTYSPSVHDALIAAAVPAPAGNDVVIEWSSLKQSRTAFSREMTGLIHELFGVYPEFMKAIVEIEGEKPINLKRSLIGTKVDVILTDSKKVGVEQAANALAEAYSRESESVQLANERWRASR
jgi:hypothetical protein